MTEAELQQVNESRLSQVHPYLAYLTRRFIQRMASEDIQIEVTQGMRTYQEQAALYAKGRTAPGPIVTSCQPGHSWHNFGLAVDVCPLDAALDPDWNDQHPAWQRICELALEMGFTVGAKFRTHPDMPHLQLTGLLPETVPPAIRLDFQDTAVGLEGIWKATRLPDPPPSE